ncbi:MAG: FAD-binding oxidoreductase [Woeseiaceae bacterium]
MARISSVLVLAKALLLRCFRLLLYAFIAYVVAIVLVVWFSGDDEFDANLHELVVNDITELNPVAMATVTVPLTVDDIVKAVQNSRGPISIGGGRYSMGGQTAIDNGLQIDMRDFDEVVGFSKEQKQITVQSGISWREVQEFIDPYDLSVKIMQTYANFSVGGSVSVNVHGRYIGHGPIISSVKSVQLVLADGSIVSASRDENPDLFFATVGGYGGIGVIAEVTLDLADNKKVSRRTKTMPVAEYRDYFRDNIRDADAVVFHNGDLYPPNYEVIRDVSWYETEEPLTIDDRLIATDEDYFWLPKLVEFSNTGSFGNWFRASVIDPLYYAPDRVVRRNWEASYDVRELGEGDRSESTWVLQEYFIPVDNFDSFVPKMRDIFQRYEVDVVNVSIRHALPDPDSYLSWARNEVFAFVIYHSQGTTTADREKVGVWTREMIDAIISENGAYYLPYQPHATIDQFRAAYPNSNRYFAVKAQVDPGNRFQNKLWEKYYPSSRSRIREYLDGLDGYRKGEEQTFLTLPEWYLVFNPNEYADFLERGNNPSDFPFFASIDEYWTLYDRVNVLTDDLYPDNAEYQVMLWVIGVSTTAEYLAKGIYENTLGRITRWTASSDTSEDKLIQEAHRAYGEMIYYEPWYEFPFLDYVGRMWGDTSFFGKNFIRKLERKLVFSGEFAFKALYAKAIGFGAATAYDAPREQVTMHIIADREAIERIDSRITVLRDFGDGDLIVSVPRWGPFTEIVPDIAAAGASFVEIAGNDEILMTTVQAASEAGVPDHARVLFDSLVVSPSEMKRTVYFVRVENLTVALNSIRQSDIALEHVFDY